MARQDAFLIDILDRLADIEGLRSRAMFGGWGLYSGATFFGIVYRGRFYLHTTASTRAGYTMLGMGPFRPNPTQTLWDYYEVPTEVFSDEARLLAWARAAVEGRR
jgi:DNA transformation protein